MRAPKEWRAIIRGPAMMLNEHISLTVATRPDLIWAQNAVTESHYLHSPVDVRSRPFAIIVQMDGMRAGCLIFGRPEATRCYQGGLTYGSQADVAVGRAMFDRWEVLNLARVWIDPRLQHGGVWCQPETVPVFCDRHGNLRSMLASELIRASLELVTRCYLLEYPPCYLDEAYQLRAVLSYCDSRLHRGVIYRQSGFTLACRNAAGIETWWCRLPNTTPEWDAHIRRASYRSPRSQRYRALRAIQVDQGLLFE